MSESNEMNPVPRIYDITIPGKPVGKARPRFGKGFVFTDKKTIMYESMIQTCLMMTLSRCFNEPIKLELIFSFLRPKSAKKRLFPSVKPDIDNCVKSVMDACNGLLYQDDSQVVCLEAKKIYSDQEFTRIVACEYSA